MNVFNSLGSNYTFLSGWQILFSYGGKETQRKLTEYLETRYGGRAILTYKGREALSLAVKALPEGAVAMNGFTCLAVYEAIAESGHSVHYLDIAENSLDFSYETFRTAVDSNSSIKAVVVQNTLGIPCDIEPIAAFCKEHGIILIEDLAHSIGARYADGREAGTVGDFVVLSFSQDKVVDAVSGGALIVRNEKYKTISPPTKKIPFGKQLKDRFYPRLTWKIRAFYPLGIGKFLHQMWRTLGILSTPFSNNGSGAHVLPGWYCANILRQYGALEKTAAHRREIAEVYARELNKDIRLTYDLKNAANLRFPILVQGRDRLIEHFREAYVYVSDTWYDAPVAPKKYLHHTNYKNECPHAEDISNRIVNLSTHINVSAGQARIIAQSLNEWLKADVDAPYTITSADKDAWEKFLVKQKPHSFLQSWVWGEQYEQGGSKIFRIAMRKGEDVVAVALFIKIDARRGSFLLCPHGPAISTTENEESLLRHIAREATRIARVEECDFIRFCPLAKPSPENKLLYHELGFRNAPIHMHPELSWMLDITKPEETLLKEMRKTTRYLIKKMEKEGVEITQSTNPEDIEKFWPIYQETVKRQHFTAFGKKDLRKEFELFAANNEATFFFGSYKGELITSAIMIFYNGQAFYHHSGSLQKFADINASYLLQWRVIQEAKRRGCTLYNFWGISPDDRPRHPWAGLSLFKKGFGGFAEEYLHAQDKPLTAKYQLNYIVETTRRIRRGL
ncbi:MAG: peptidoglycan bridge formation glycyltransferase FemA/FemB family protein [bacterium]|nr:peptidoglycan bridge formation glycyltransferase FemA/FemB family protein [bacterium]